MKNFYMPSDVRAADGTAAERYEVPSVVLMENAARAAADAAEAMARGDGQFVPARGGECFEDAPQLPLHGQPSFSSPAARRSAHFTPSTAAERMPPA